MAKNRPKKDDPEKERLALEIKERKWWLVKVLVPVITALGLGIWYGIQWRIQIKQQKLQIEQQRLETERQRLETITNLKREFASDNPSIRIAAALDLANYPKEAIPVLIHSLRDEDTAFTKAIKDSFRQIGKDAIMPLVQELRRLQAEVYPLFAPIIRKLSPDLKSWPESGMTWYVVKYFSMDELLKESLEDTKNKLKAFIPDDEIGPIITKLDNIRSSGPGLRVAHKNTVEALTELLSYVHLERGQLWGLDLSGAFLSGVNLSGAVLLNCNLSNANLLANTNLSSADLSNTNFSGAILTRANLSGSDISFANLSSARLCDADLTGVKGFRDIENFNGADLRGVKGLSKEDLEYAKLKGAIID